MEDIILKPVSKKYSSSVSFGAVSELSCTSVCVCGVCVSLWKESELALQCDVSFCEIFQLNSMGKVFEEWKYSF